MPELEEFRYPFMSIIEFFTGGYWFKLPALHLTFAWLCVLVMVPMVLWQRRDMGQKLLALYFSLTLFNNYCFQIGGTSLGDMFGIVSAIFLLQKAAAFPAKYFHLTWVARFVLTCASIFTVHALAISMLYPDLNEGSSGVIRFAVIAKVAILGICVILFRSVFHEIADVDWLLNQIVNFAVVALICYLIQIGVLLTGNIPYGTFLDAGYVGMPSFGSVSIERGHLGKFLTPLYPFFLLMWLRHRRTWPFFLFCIVTMANFSASSLSYFTFYLLMTAWIFRRNLTRAKTFFWAAAALTVILIFVVSFRTVLYAVVLKVVELALEGGSTGGRGIGVLLEYLSRYPLGMSYGGSSLRIGPGMNEINSGIFAFISQLSVLSVPLIAFLIFLEVKVIWEGRRIGTPYFRSILTMGTLMMLIIFSADLLWFVPTIWLPLILCEQLSTMRENRAVYIERSAPETA